MVEKTNPVVPPITKLKAETKKPRINLVFTNQDRTSIKIYDLSGRFLGFVSAYSIKKFHFPPGKYYYQDYFGREGGKIFTLLQGKTLHINYLERAKNSYSSRRVIR